MENYERTVTLSARKTLFPDELEYFARVSPPIELESSSVDEIVNASPFKTMFELMRLIEDGEEFERSQDPEYDGDVNPMNDQRKIDLEVQIDATYVGNDNQLPVLIEYLLTLYVNANREKEDVRRSIDFIDNSGGVTYLL
jgi:hypothetical protein